MAHLLALGHRKIGHLAAAVDTETFHLRHLGYHAALQAIGQPVVPLYEQHARFDIADARQAALRILTAPELPTAILCDSDHLAAGIYKAASDLHLSIPHDLSVIGFDDSMIATLLEPELTTVAIPTAAIGAQAFLLLLAVLTHETAPAETVFPVHLVIRPSTTSPSPRAESLTPHAHHVDR
jgi:LacI family transcriptional regulator